MKGAHPHLAARVALLYAFLAGLWILFSDRVLAVLGTDPRVVAELQIYKSWALVAVAATLLYLERKSAEKKARRADQAIEMVSKCNQVLVRATKEPELLSEICRLIVDIGGYRLAWVGFEQGAEKAVRLAAYAEHEEGYLESARIAWAEVERGRSPASTAIRTGKPCAVRNMLTDPAHGRRRAEAVQRGHVSSIALPLISTAEGSAHQVLGALNIYAGETGAFDSEEVGLLTELADDLAHGIMALRAQVECQRVGKELRRCLHEMAAFSAIAATVSQSLDLNKILNDTLDKSLEVMPLDGEARGGIFLLDEGAAELRLAALRGLPKFTERETHVKLDKCLCGHAVKTGELVDATRVEAWPDGLGRVEPHGHLLVPLKSRGRVLGVMFLYLPTAFRPGEQTLELLAAIGSQIGVGVENAQLYDRLWKQPEDMELLYEVGRWLSSSLEPHKVLSQVAGRCVQVFEADACLVHLVEGDLLNLRASYFRDEAAYSEAERQLWAAPHCVGEGLTGWVVMTGESVLSAKVDPAQFALVDDAEYVQPHDWLLVPLRAQDRVLGALTLIVRRKQRRFSERDLALAQEVANQAAAALENARLYEQASQRLEQVSLIQAVALDGAAGRPLDGIIADATQHLGRLWDSRHLGFLFPDETGALHAHASYVGLSPEARRTLRFRPGQGLAGWVFQTGKPIVVPDVREDARYVPTSPETRSAMGAPLLAGDCVIGVINAESTRVNAFSADDIQLLAALAGQLAIILDDAQAHRDLAARAQQLQDAYNKLAEAEQMRDQIIQNLSHELRTPMTFLKGYTELLLDRSFGPLPPALHGPLEIVSQKTDTVVRLVERIVSLQTVRPETLAVEPLGLTELIQEAVNRWMSQLQQAGIEIWVDLPVGLPFIAADRSHMGEALDNLLSNACKFNRAGGQVVIRLRADHDAIHVEVADTGIGIPPDKLSKVFDRFYQVDGTTKRRFGGTGVGLALVKQVIEAHGGRVWAESPGLGQGSTFHLVLPTVPVPQLPQPL